MLNRSVIVSIVKLIVAAVLLTGLIALATQDLMPQMSYVKLFVYLLLGVAVLAVNLVGLVVIYLNISQWALRKGGTDPSWFWFASFAASACRFAGLFFGRFAGPIAFDRSVACSASVQHGVHRARGAGP